MYKLCLSRNLPFLNQLRSLYTLQIFSGEANLRPLISIKQQGLRAPESNSDLNLLMTASTLIVCQSKQVQKMQFRIQPQQKKPNHHHRHEIKVGYLASTRHTMNIKAASQTLVIGDCILHKCRYLLHFSGTRLILSNSLQDVDETCNKHEQPYLSLQGNDLGRVANNSVAFAFSRAVF